MALTILNFNLSHKYSECIAMLLKRRVLHTFLPHLPLSIQELQLSGD